MYTHTNVQTFDDNKRGEKSVVVYEPAMDKSVDVGDNSNQPRKKKLITNSFNQLSATQERQTQALVALTPEMSFPGLKDKGEASHVNEFKSTISNDTVCPEKNHGKNIIWINYPFPKLRQIEATGKRN